MTVNEAVSIASRYVNRHWDNVYLTRYNGLRDGGHDCVTFLFGPDGPQVHTHIYPNGWVRAVHRP